MWKWQALCPAYDDTKLSLSICEDEESNVGLKCFENCTTEDTCKSIYLKKSDLFVKEYFPLFCTYNYWDEDYNQC